MTAESPVRAETAAVWRGGERTGTLTRTATGAVFEYDDAFLARRPGPESGIATTLPYSSRRFETSGVNLHPFFAGLLPEGLRLSALVRAVKTSQDDLFSLLVACGADTVGDIAVGTGPAEPAEAGPEADLTRTGELVFDELFARSLADPNPPYAVAGVQRKVSAGRVSLLVRSRRGAAPSILKLGTPDLPHLVENEAFLLSAARDCGLPTPEFRVVRDRTGAAALAVGRFDRIAAAKGAPAARVHQEDACQFLGRYPADKYRLTLQDVADGLAEVCAAPHVAVAWLLRLQAFSYVTANGDLHARNVSVRRIPGTSRHEPTPAYDLVCTLPYGDDRMALAMEGRDRNLRRRDFVAFGARHGVREAAVQALLDAVCDGTEPWIARVGEIGFEAKATRHVQRTMASRVAGLRQRARAADAPSKRTPSS